jgi:hypothetical protein
MTTSAIIFGLGLVLLSAFYIVRPFFDNALRPDRNRSGGRRYQLLEQKAAIYAAIREIDADVQVGKLEPADHRALRRRYVLEGVSVLKALDELPPADEIDAAIEQDLARFSSGEGPELGQLFCTECGAQADPGDLFCAKCGARL